MDRSSDIPAKSVAAERRRGLPGSARRRPSGEAPPLPHDLGRTGKFWLFMVTCLIVMLIGIVLFQPMHRLFEHWDGARLRWIATLRTPGLTRVALFLNALTSPWTIRVLRWGAIGTLIAFRRWRHLLLFLTSVIALEIITYQISVGMGRPRPLGVTIVGDWAGYSMPSRPLASLAVTLIAMAFALVVPGRHRFRAKVGIAIVLGVALAARMYLAVDTPTGGGFGAILGVAVGLTAFRWFTPNDIFPVSYRRGKAAHLDVGGVRGEAIVRGARDQLGLTVLEAKPVGLEGSGGPTPLRLRIAAADGGPERYVFAKLYAKSHVRADRWYKLCPG